MTRYLPLIALFLAACSSPFEEFLPAETHTFKSGTRTYVVRAQYDPFERGWFARVSLPNGMRLEPDDRAAVLNVVQDQLGPKVCDGEKLEVVPEVIWTRHGGKTIHYLPQIGMWQLVGTCA